MEQQTMCTACGEWVATDSAFCPKCGAKRGAEPPAMRPAVSTPVHKPDTLGVLLALTPYLGAGLCWIWVANSPLISASNNLGAVLALVVLGTALMAALDANARGFGAATGPAPKENGPVGTFVATAFLWVLVYPLYMFRRARHGAGRFGAAAIVGTILFLGSAGLMLVTIEEAARGLRGGPPPNRMVVQVIAFADEACACTDNACTESVNQRFTDFVAHHADEKGSEGDKALVEKAAERMMKCLATSAQ